MADRWSNRDWTTEERRALAGLGPAWRLAKRATGEVACPACGAEPWTRCPSGLHDDRLFAYAAHLRAINMAPPSAASVAKLESVVSPTLTGARSGEIVRRGVSIGQFGVDSDMAISRNLVACDATFDLAIHHGLLRLATSPERWVLSDYGAACWCQP